MSLEKRLSDLIKEFADTFKTADDFRREVEEFRGKPAASADGRLILATVYVFTGMFDAEGKLRDSLQLARARTECWMAMYFAATEGLRAVVAELEGFRKSYRFIAISSVCKEYTDICARLPEAERMVIQELDLNIEDQIADRVAMFRQLHVMLVKLRGARRDLNAARWRVRFAVVAIVIPAVALLWSILKS